MNFGIAVLLRLTLPKLAFLLRLLVGFKRQLKRRLAARIGVPRFWIHQLADACCELTVPT